MLMLYLAAANDGDSSKRNVTRHESVPIMPIAVPENREPRKRSNSIDDPSSAVKLITSEADSLFMQRADGKVERRHTEYEKTEIDKSLELLDELVVELSENKSPPLVTPSERPTLSRNVDGKSAGSASDVVMSPSQSQTSIYSEKSTSGSDQIDRDVTISALPELSQNLIVEEITEIHINKSDPSRSHSDPIPRVQKDYNIIQETIAEYDIKARNSNSEPAINGRLLEEAADLVKAKAAEKENNSESKPGIERTSSSPADLQAVVRQPTQKLRRRESEKARRRQAAKAAQIEANTKEVAIVQDKLENSIKSLPTQNDQQSAKINNDSFNKSSKSGQAITAGVEHHTWPRSKTEPETNDGTQAATGKKKKASKSVSINLNS